MKNLRKISAVMTCKGRLSHIKQSLPSLVACGFAEIVFVDYDCPEKSGEYVSANFPSVTVIRVSDRPHFNVAHARNVGAYMVKTDRILFIDADVMAQPNLQGWIDTWSMDDDLCVAHGWGNKSGVPDLSGTFFIKKHIYDSLNGFDEYFCGWGGEDNDFFLRAQRARYSVKTYPPKLFSAIRHGDEERVRFAPIRNMTYSKILNRIYLNSKHVILGQPDYLGVTELPVQLRKELRYSIESQLAEAKKMERSSKHSAKIQIKKKEYSKDGLTMRGFYILNFELEFDS